MKRKGRLAFGGTALVALAAGFGFFLFDTGVFRLNHPPPDRFPVRGIDVSHHQGEINWPRVANRGRVDFAYIKATEGGDFKDPRFAVNWREAKRAGILRGAYHFFTFCKPGAEQARNFLETVPRDAEALPLAVDLEFIGNCAARPSREALLEELKEFYREVTAHFPGKPVFYVTQSFFDAYMRGHRDRFPDHHLWLRDIFREPAQVKCESWDIWQYSHRGRVAGIKGLVDLNVYCADPVAFAELRKPPRSRRLFTAAPVRRGASALPLPTPPL